MDLLWYLIASSLLVAGADSQEYDRVLKKDAPETQHWFLKADFRHTLLNTWGNRESPLLAAVDSRIDNDTISESCRDDTDFSNVLTSSWAQRMFDASVKIPEGLASLVTTHLGNWDQCVNIRNVQSTNGNHTFHGQMCMINLIVPISLGKTAALRQTQARAINLPLRLGVCLPSSCSAEDVTVLFSSMFKQSNSRIIVTVDAKDCTTEDRPPLDAVDWFAVSILICLGVIVVLSTIYDVFMPERKRKILLTAFSVITNGQKLLAIPHARGDQTLSCLHGIRFISMCWVVLAHRYMRSGGGPTINPLFRAEVYQDFWHLFITNGTLSVDTFLVLSGLLVGYLFFKQVPSKRRLNIPMYYIHRYIRLTPALAMMVLLTASLMSHFGWGPLWSSLTDPERDVCRNNWWNTLLYIGNYVNADVNCVSQSWYLMVDMQLHWLSPLVILPLAIKPKYGFIWSFFLCLGGIIGCFVFVFQSYPTNMMNVAYFQKYYYNATYMRFVPYLEGLLVGYYIAELHLKNQLKPHSLLICILGWIFVAALMLVPFLVYWEFLKQPLPSQTASAFYLSLNRPTWSLGVALLVYLCARGNGSAVNAFLSWTGFQILGRFSYCVYLVHFGMQLDIVAASKTLGYLSDATIWTQFASDLLMSLIFAAILSLLCESPFLVIEKQLLGGHKQKKEDQATTEQQPTIDDDLRKEKSNINV